MDKYIPRMYSLNLAAYIVLVTGLFPEIEFDSESATYYFVFPQCSAVGIAINEFRNGKPLVKLNDFLEKIRQLRQAFKEKEAKRLGRKD